MFSSLLMRKNIDATIFGGNALTICVSIEILSVKLGNSVSTWLKLNGAVPQGSWLGPLCFIVYMNDMELQDGTLTHKYIDDITISESTSCSNVSLLQTAVDKVKEWSDKNNMKLNENKTKEMYISFKQNPAPVPPLIINSNAVERVHSFKILGV